MASQPTNSDDDVGALKERLRRLASSVPPAYQSWSYGRVVDFKEKISEAAKLLSKQKPSKQALAAAISALERFR